MLLWEKIVTGAWLQQTNTIGTQWCGLGVLVVSCVLEGEMILLKKATSLSHTNIGLYW